MVSWIKNKLQEKSKADGLFLIAVGSAFIVLGPLAKIAAYVAIAYGLWTVLKK